MLSVQLIFSLIYENLFSFALLVVLIGLFQHLISSYVSRKRLPPGPTGLPIVGYLPFLGKAPHKTITKLGDKYGSVFTVQLGVYNVVILNDYEAVKDAFSNDALLGRPKKGQFYFLGRPKAFGGGDIRVWRDQRRFSLQILRDLGFGKGSMEDKIVDEIQYLKESIDKKGKEPIDIKKTLTPSMSNNISHLVFGHRMETDDPKRIILDNVINGASALFSPIGMLCTTPSWFSDIVLRIGSFSQKKVLDQMNQIFVDEISYHQKTFDENNMRDYIDGFLAEMQKKESQVLQDSFDLKNLNTNAFGFFGAGSETVKTTTEWCLLTAAHYTDYQKKVQAEIDSVVGKERAITYSDRLRMPFTQAFICEIFRWKPTISLNLYRKAEEDTHVLNHFIPKDTLILANFWSIHNDPKIWKEPDQFKPNRFLTADGKDIIKTDHLMPFSIGKRSCPGESLARVEIFLYFASILQKYTISAANGETLSFEERFGLSLQPKNNPMIVFKKRT